jgi:hypothetical protein
MGVVVLLAFAVISCKFTQSHMDGPPLGRPKSSQSPRAPLLTSSERRRIVCTTEPTTKRRALTVPIGPAEMELFPARTGGESVSESGLSRPPTWSRRSTTKSLSDRAKYPAEPVASRQRQPYDRLASGQQALKKADSLHLAV